MALPVTLADRHSVMAEQFSPNIERATGGAQPILRAMAQRMHDFATIDDPAVIQKTVESFRRGAVRGPSILTEKVPGDLFREISKYASRQRHATLRLLRFSANNHVAHAAFFQFAVDSKRFR